MDLPKENILQERSWRGRRDAKPNRHGRSDVFTETHDFAAESRQAKRQEARVLARLEKESPDLGLSPMGNDGVQEKRTERR